MDLTVITATWQRPQQLIACLEAFRRQDRTGLSCEHLVVSDGPDREARHFSQMFAARYHERAGTGGMWGAAARDDGIRLATGTYVCFWDDDNLYDPQALQTLLSAARGVDIGLVQTRYRCRSRPGSVVIPRRWTGTFRPGDVDTMCVCVRHEVALLERWSDPTDPQSIANDADWLTRLQRHGPTIRFVPETIGWHL